MRRARVDEHSAYLWKAPRSIGMERPTRDQACNGQSNGIACPTVLVRSTGNLDYSDAKLLKISAPFDHHSRGSRGSSHRQERGRRCCTTYGLSRDRKTDSLD